MPSKMIRLPEPKVMKRPTEIWETPCEKCPSAHGPGDPESDQILEWCKSGEMTFEEATFPCAWRGKKLCKGVCDEVKKAMDERRKQMIERTDKTICSVCERKFDIHETNENKCVECIEQEEQ